MRESVIEKAVCDYARRRGCLVYKFTSPARSAVPDRIIVAPTGQTGFLEFKAPGKKPTRCQSHEIERLKANNAKADWSDNIDGGKAFVDKLCELN